MGYYRQLQMYIYIPLKIVIVMFGIPHRRTQDECSYNMNFITSILHGKKYLNLYKMQEKPLQIIHC